MTRAPWYPKRSRAAWRVGAPDYICDVFDDGKAGDRYMVFFTGPDFGADLDERVVHYLGLSGAPTHPQGVSMWGAITSYQFAAYRYRFGRHRIKWCDLPEVIRSHVIDRATVA
jgi:hypothetical protein